MAAASPETCAAISEAQPIVPLTRLVERGSAAAKEQAAGCLSTLADGSAADSSIHDYW